MPQVLGARELAAELAAAAAAITDAVEVVTTERTEEIRGRWMDEVPDSPGGYEGAGFTSSPGANKAEVTRTATGVKGDAYNQSFVAWFIQGGTSHHDPKYDFIGAAEPSVEGWLSDVDEEAAL